ncbi:MAG: alcohol dehydrogenase catalytic domain-containing protein [Paracoccaceae bacterium]
MKARAAVMYGRNGPLFVEDLELSPPHNGEVLIRMGAAGGCHSDYHVISGQAAHDLPVVFRHESAGEVVALGGGVKHLSIGDHVVLGGISYCGDWRGADRVFEAVGKSTLQRAAIEYFRPGRQVTFVGLDSNDVVIDLPTAGITRSEIAVSGSIYGSSCTTRVFQAYAQHYMNGDLPIDRLIGRRYELDQINDAIGGMLSGKPGCGVIRFDWDQS